jgi:L-lactate dehydrogenase
MAMMMRGVGSELVLVDRKADLAVAQAHDILDATPFACPARVRAGEVADKLDRAYGRVTRKAAARLRPSCSQLAFP